MKHNNKKPLGPHFEHMMGRVLLVDRAAFKVQPRACLSAEHMLPLPPIVFLVVVREQ